VAISTLEPALALMAEQGGFRSVLRVFFVSSIRHLQQQQQVSGQRLVGSV